MLIFIDWMSLIYFLDLKEWYRKKKKKMKTVYVIKEIEIIVRTPAV